MKVILSLCLLWSLVCLAATNDSVSLYCVLNAHEKFFLSYCAREPCIVSNSRGRIGSVALFSEFHCLSNEFASLLTLYTTYSLTFIPFAAVWSRRQQNFPWFAIVRFVSRKQWNKGLIVYSKTKGPVVLVLFRFLFIRYRFCVGSAFITDDSDITYS